MTDLRLGGTQRMILERVRGIGGWEHHVWAPVRVSRHARADLVEELRAAGARVRYGRRGMLGLGLWIAGGIARARRLRFDVVHSTLYHTHLLAPWFANACDAAWILGKESTDDWMTCKQARREVLLTPRVSAVAAVSRAAAKAMERAGRIEVPVRIIPNGIPDGPPPWGVAPEPDALPRIVYVGRLDPAKGLADLVEACYRLLREGRGLRLQIQGEGPADGALRAAFANPPFAGRARVLGREEARAEAGAASAGEGARAAAGSEPGGGPAVFVLPSHFEGFGVVLLEAMRLSLPIVATRVGGIPEVVEEGVQALLVPPRDPQALAGAIGRLLDDDALRTQLGAAGPARAARFPAHAMCDAYAELYEEVRAGVRARRRRA
ncbi:MAG: glycosyltransferase family 4 protein [Candidatus Eisenbacteria bacterium]